MNITPKQAILILNALQEQAEHTDYGFLSMDHDQLYDTLESFIEDNMNDELDSLNVDIENNYSSKT